jgi:hypothetical protein
MKCILIKEGKGPVDNLYMGEEETPEPAKGQVQVKIKVCCLAPVQMWTNAARPHRPAWRGRRHSAALREWMRQPGAMHQMRNWILSATADRRPSG